MNIKKYLSFAAASVMIISLIGCKSVQKADTPDPTDESSSSVSETQAVTETKPAESYPDYPISYPTIEEHETVDTYEAENCTLENGLTIDTAIDNYSGYGYVSGFAQDSETPHGVTFSVEVPSNQHYDLSFCIASEEAAECTISVNDAEISRFSSTDDGAFTIITLYGVFLVKGESDIKISTSGDIALDYLKLSNNTTLSEISYDADGELSNVNAAESAKELMSFLTDNYGKYVITGQFVSDETNGELELVYRTTGKYPVIRFAALDNSGDTFDSNYKAVDAAADWYRNGGIIGFMWFWESPGNEPSVYAKDTDFKLSDAVTDIDIATMTQEEIRALYGEGKISEQCYGIILDIDNMAGQLLSLKNKGIPVLWRPLHEASGDWYWWGASGTEAYKWLWELMYTRMTEYFELDNLIWIWNGQSADTLVDKDTFDIASADIYLGEGKEFGSRYEQFASLQKLIGSDKLIALSECSAVPDIDAVFRDNAVWSFFGLWYGNYLDDGDGNYSTLYMTKESFIRTYNSDGALTLDEYQKMKESDSESSSEPTSEATSEASSEAASESASETASSDESE